MGRDVAFHQVEGEPPLNLGHAQSLAPLLWADIDWLKRNEQSCLAQFPAELVLTCGGTLGAIRESECSASPQERELGRRGLLPAADELLASLQEAERGALLAANNKAKPISGDELINIAERLGRDPHRWESRTTGKCNLFVDAVFRTAHIPLPWDSVHIPGSHGMRVAFDKASQSPRSGWQKIYCYDPAHGLQSDEQFTHYQPNNGDVIIWDKVWADKWVEHSGIAMAPYDMLYAGARDQPHRPPKHGFGKTNIYNFTGKPPYGAPSAVYRCIGLK